MNKLVDLAVYGLMKVFLFIGKYLPERIIYSFGWLLGELYYRLFPAKRDLARYNLTRALAPETVSSSLLRRNFQRIGMIASEFLLIASWSDEKLQERVNIEGREHLEEALGEGKGAIIAGGHIGNWELMLVALARAGFPCYSIVTEQSMPRTNELIFSLRRKMGLGLIQKSGFGLRKSYEVLSENSVLLVMMDQYGGEKGLEVEFFGSKTSTAKGAAYLAQRTGAPLLPVSIRPRGRGYYSVVVKEALAVEGREIHDILRDLNSHLEDEIRLAPMEWLSPTRRWRTPSERVALDA